MAIMLANPLGEYIAELSQELNTVYTRVERRRNVVIPSNVRAFVEALIVESIVLRSDEWQIKEHIDLNDSGDRRQSIALVTDRATGILQGASPLQSAGIDYVPVISTIETIKDNWCGIFPFCR